MFEATMGARAAAALGILERMQPGAMLWSFAFKDVDPRIPGLPARLVRVMDESRPPWVRPPPRR